MSKLAVISVDGHVKASRTGYRDYIEGRYLDEFDAWVASMEGMPDAGNKNPKLPDASQWDSNLRLEHLEAQGVAAEVLFPNGLAFVDARFQDAATSNDRELAREGRRAYNRWLADFCSQVAGRRAGQAVVSFDDIDEAIDDVHWAKAHGLMGISMPALQPGGTYFFDEKLDPVWAAIQDVDLPISQHGGNGLPQDYPPGFAAIMAIALEQSFFSGRSMWQLMIGGVFERFPNLRYALVETMVDWVPGTLRFMDGLAARSDWMEFARMMGREPTMKKLPTEYWAANCFAGCSPPARIDYELRYELGVDTMMFGVDYPHFESIWPVTKETLQGTLGWIGVPEQEARKILMENPARAYGFDLEALAPHVERVGYEVSELLDPSNADPGGGGIGLHRPGHAPLTRAAI
ncbi:MAG: amidohydrolase family protein [Acidimicrobiia bacterium]